MRYSNSQNANIRGLNLTLGTGNIIWAFLFHFSFISSASWLILMGVMSTRHQGVIAFLRIVIFFWEFFFFQADSHMRDDCYMGHTHHSLQDNLELMVCSMFTVTNMFGAWHHLLHHLCPVLLLCSMGLFCPPHLFCLLHLLYFLCLCQSVVSISAANTRLDTHLLLPSMLHFHLFFPPLLLACLHLCNLGIVLQVTHQLSVRHLDPGMWHVWAMKFKHILEQSKLQFKCAYRIRQTIEACCSTPSPCWVHIHNGP